MITMQQVPENQPAVTLARIQSIRVDEICEQAAVAIAHLRGVIRRGCQSLPHFQRNYDLLRGLPMPSQNIALATLRLDNALRYCDDRNSGAALFEINLFHGSIRGLVECARKIRATTKSRV